MNYGFYFDYDDEGDSPRKLVEAMPDTKVSRGRKKGCMPSGMCCIRTTLISFNLITGLVGVCVLAAGVLLFIASVNGEQSGIGFFDDIVFDNDLSKNNFHLFSILCIIVGTLIGFISFVGCFGACVSSRCLLITYLVSVILTVLLQLLVSIYAIVNSERVNNSMKEMFIDLLQNRNKLDNETMRAVDAIQNNFECCGVSGFSDYFPLDEGEQVVPDSCCLDYTPGCGKEMEQWKRVGCLSKINIYIINHLPILALVIVGIVFLQLYGIISSILLFFHIRVPKRPHPFQSYRYERAKM